MKTQPSKDNKKIEIDDGLNSERRAIERTIFLESIRPEALINDIVSVELIDMSKDGLMFKSDTAFIPGKIINITCLPKNILEAEVKWIKKDDSSEEFYVGVQFIKSLDEKSTLIDELCDIKNKREFERNAPAKPLNVEFWDPESKSKLRDIVTVADMSSGGLKVKIARQLEVGSIVKIKIAENMIMSGEIRWCLKVDKYKELYFAGIMFVKEEEKKEIKIDDCENMLERGDTMKDGSVKIKYFNKLAIAFRRAGRVDYALDSYKRAIRLDPDNEVLFFNMARVFLDLNKPEEAEGALEKALKIDSEFIEAEELLAKIRKK